jgi:hypothetical protein
MSSTPYLHAVAVALKCLLGLLLALGLSQHFFPEQTKRFVMKLFGSVRYIQIADPELTERIRVRYQSEIGELASLGFKLQFDEAQASSLFSAIFIFPAIVMLLMRLNNEVIAIRGTDFLTARPIFASSDKTSYAHPGGLGTIFHTTFNNNSLLITANYGESTTIQYPTGARRMRDVIKGATIADTWDSHQRRIRAIKSSCRGVSTEISFDAYIEIIR